MITRSQKEPLQHHGTSDEMMSLQSQKSLVRVGDVCLLFFFFLFFLKKKNLTSKSGDRQ